MNKLKKIIEYGLYLLVFLLPWQTRWIIKAGELNGGYWEYGTYNLYLTDILLVVLLALCFAKFIISKDLGFKIYDLRIKKIWYFIAGLDLVIFVSVFFAADKSLAAYKYIVFLLGVGLYWLITKATYNKIKLIFYFLAGVFLQASLGIWQFFTQSSFANKWLGLAVHYPGVLGTAVIETLTGERWLRAYGGLDHPNILGGLLAVGIMLLIWSKLIFQISNSKILFFTFYFLLLTFSAALFFTFSRGAWAGLLLGLLLILVVAVWKKDLETQKKLLQIILIASILVFILFSQYQDLVLTRLSNDTRLEIKSNTERVYSYQTAMAIIKKHWLLGEGIGNYTLAVHNEIDRQEPSWYYQPVHNTFFLIWGEVGILGLVFFIIILFYKIIYNFSCRGVAPLRWWQFLISKRFINFKFPKLRIRNWEIGIENELDIYKKEDSYLSFSLTASALTMMLADHWWWSLHFGVLFFWLLAGLIISNSLVKAR